MAPSDALFWYAERALPRLRPAIGGLFLLDRPPDAERLRAAHDAAIARVPRLRQRVVAAPLELGPPVWADDPHLDRAYHVRHLGLPAPGGRRELLDLVAQLFATPLDPQRPLWEAYALEGLEGGRAAYFFKLHHSVVDGVGAIALLEALTQAARDEPPLRVTAARAAPGAAHGLAAFAGDELREALRLAGRAAGAPLAALRRPGATLGRAVRTARGVAALTGEALRPPLRDPLAAGSAGLSRRLDVADIPLERLRKLKAPLGVSLNDVVLAALAAALRAYHRERGVRAEALQCLVPMNLRAKSQREELGNRVGIFTVRLPLGERSPRRRLAAVVAQTRRAKRDQRGAAVPFLVQSLTLLPGPAFRWLARQSLGRVNVACTNIPGPPERRYVAGAAVEALYPFASVVEGTPLVTALLSYAGTLHVGIDTDPEAIPHPHRIVELYERGLAELEALAAGRPTAE